MVSERDYEMAAAVLVLLADHGISPDFGEVLLGGNPTRGIRPGALYAVIEAIRADQVERDAKSNPFRQLVYRHIDGMSDIAPECGFSAERILEDFVRAANAVVAADISAIRQKGSDHAG